MTKNITIVFGIVFILVGILGFIPNPIVGSTGIFETDLGHNLVHLAAGVILLFAGMQSEQLARLGLQVFGAVYLLVGLAGFAVVDSAVGHGSLLNLVHLNSADNWLHIALGVVLIGIGFGVKKLEMA